jgi:5-methylcytosine-specific restriction enzyme A
MPYTIITENDTSQWKDRTGDVYHFPKRYLKLLERGTKVIYYKGRLLDEEYRNKRLTSDPHYFGMAEIGNIYPDQQSRKNDYYADIINFSPFSRAVPFKIDDSYIEVFPASRTSNWWRDGVRETTRDVYERIIRLAGLTADANQSNTPVATTNDLNQGKEEAYESMAEGNIKERYTSYYERNPKLRQQAVNIHGYACQVCGFDFKKTYGKHGEGFIHVHHIKPISEIKKEVIVNPKDDLTVLCANCHSMIHRYRYITLSIEELKAMINKNKV